MTLVVHQVSGQPILPPIRAQQLFTQMEDQLKGPAAGGAAGSQGGAGEWGTMKKRLLGRSF